LQYACIFPLDAPRDCNAGDPSCDCYDPSTLPPLCDPAQPMRQVSAKAYPGIRPLQRARRLGDNAVASSIRPTPAAPPESPDIPVHLAYTGAMRELGDRMARALVPFNR
jgi:hypothetical protein